MQCRCKAEGQESNTRGKRAEAMEVPTWCQFRGQGAPLLSTKQMCVEHLLCARLWAGFLLPMLLSPPSPEQTNPLAAVVFTERQKTRGGQRASCFVNRLKWNGAVPTCVRAACGCPPATTAPLRSGNGDWMVHPTA